MQRRVGTALMLAIVACPDSGRAQSGQPPVEAHEPAVPTRPGITESAGSQASAAVSLDRLRPIVRTFATDVRRLSSIETALVLGAAGAAALGVRHRDGALTARAAASPTFDRVFEAGEVLGGGGLQAGGALATYAAGRFLGRAAVAEVGSDLLRAQLLNGVLTQGVKLSVRRARPDGGAYSFPSGHTSSSFAVATVLGDRFGWKVSVPAYTVAAFVGASRLSENRHYLSDVVFGAAIGVVAGRTIRLGRREEGLTVAPIASRGIAGVKVSWRTGS